MLTNLFFLSFSSPCQNTRILSANLVAGPASPLKPLQQSGYIAPYTIRNYNGGKDKVAIIGVDVRNKTLTGSQPDPGTTLTDEREAVRKQVNRLTNRGINKIIVLSHLGYNRDIHWLTKIQGVDVVVGGHTHTLLGSKSSNMDGVRGTSETKAAFPQFKQDAGNSVCVVQAWKMSHGLGRLRVEFDDNGKVVACGGQFIIPFEPNPEASSAEQALVSSYLAGLGNTFEHVSQNNKAMAILKVYSDSAGKDVDLSKSVATIHETICNDAIPGQRRNSQSLDCKPIHTMDHGGAACNIVAQAMLDQTADADVAIQNAGGCRSDIQAGNLTYGDVMEFLPYSDILVTVDLTGAQIKHVLEQALDLAFRGESTGSYPYASGLRYDVNATVADPSGFLSERITNLQINARLEEGTWNDIDMNTTYRVVTNSFLAAGHDGYLEFADASNYQHDTQTTYLDAFVRYVEERGGSLSAPDLEDMSTHIYVGPTEEEAQAAAETAENDSNDELNGIWIAVSDDPIAGGPEADLKEGTVDDEDTTNLRTNQASSGSHSSMLFSLLCCSSLTLLFL